MRIEVHRDGEQVVITSTLIHGYGDVEVYLTHEEAEQFAADVERAAWEAFGIQRDRLIREEREKYG